MISLKACKTCEVEGMYNADQVRCNTCDTLLVPMSLIPTAELLTLRSDLEGAKTRAKQAEENWHKNEARVAKLQRIETIAEEVNEWLKNNGLMGTAHQRELEAALKGAE